MSMISSVESSSSGEAALSSDQFFDLLGRVATGDAKLVVANRFAALQGENYKSRDFSMALDELAPDGWTPNWRTISGYCKLSLEPAEVLKHVGGEGPYGSRYQATHYGASVGLGLGGVVNEWSLATPDLSTHQVFGTNTGRGDQESAQRRFLTLSYLLDKNSPVSACDIVDDLDNAIPLHGVEKQIQSLQQSGIIDYSSKDQTYSPVFTLTEPNPKYGVIKQASTVRLYQTLEELYENGIEEISFEDLLGRTLDGTDPTTVDPEKLRQTLVFAATRDRNIPCITATEPPEQRRSKVLLKDEFRGKIQSLLTSLEEFRASPNRLAHQKTGLEIVSDGPSIRQLFDKWERTSSKVKRANDKELAASNAQIISAVEQLGKATLPSIYAALEEQRSGLSRATIKARLRGLADAGRLTSSAEQMDRTKKRIREVFEVATPTESA